MNPSTLLLNAYYERLYELLEAERHSLSATIEQLLPEETSKIPVNLNNVKFSALKEACLALLEERIEMYNPIGIQYTFDRLRSKQARQLELQLDWFDSQQEFENLIQAVCNRSEEDMCQQRTHELADNLIKEMGAFPNKSIIETYKQKPALNKLPDYILALAIEQTVR
jgi:predicted transcriptional regulator